jgi:hypothetical protein
MAQENSESPSLHHLAGEALLRLRGLSPEEQSQGGVYVLNHARQSGDEKTRDLAERALLVMEKFPNFPRPRAAVVMRALETIAKET